MHKIVFLLLSFLLYFSVLVSCELTCSGNSDLTVFLKHSSKEKGTNIYETTLIVDNLYNGATVCFDLIAPDGGIKRYAIKVDSLIGTANFEDQYEFGIPEIMAKCTCSCSDSFGLQSECSAKENKFCESYSSDDRCVDIKRETEQRKGCASVGSSAKYCCAIGMKQSSMNSTFKAIKVRDQQQYNFQLTIYPDYDDEELKYQFIQKMQDVRRIDEDNLLFTEVTGNIQNTEQIVSPVQWYIGKSDPYVADVYEYPASELEAKNGFDITKVGFAKLIDKIYNLDGPTDPEIEEAFSANIEDCGSSKITTTFNSPQLKDFMNDLDPLRERHSAYVDEVSWETDGPASHGTVSWKFKEFVIKTDLNLVFQGKAEDYKVEKVSSRARVGSFQSDVVVSEFGHRLLRINLTDSLGTIHASYVPAPDRNPIAFTFDVTNSSFQIKYYRNTELECLVNQALGKLCLEGTKCIHNVRCKETMIKESDIPNQDIVTETVVSDGLGNLKSWLKYANPFEWFNGISSYQELIVMLLQLGGMFGGVFLVLKVLKTMGFLGKCCRYMWCCFLCPKTEKKVRQRASTVRQRLNTRYRDTKTSVIHRARTFTYSVKGKKSGEISDQEVGKIDECMNRKSFYRTRLNTDAIMKYVRQKMNLDRPSDLEFGSKADLIEFQQTHSTPTTPERNLQNIEVATLEESTLERNLDNCHKETINLADDKKAPGKKPVSKAVSWAKP